MTRRTKLAIGAAVALLGGAAGVMLASGDGDTTRTRGEAVAAAGVDDHGVASSALADHALLTTTADPGGWCPKCDGPMSAPLTDDDIRQAGDAAQIVVLGLREPRGAGDPVWHDWQRGAYTVPEVPLPAMPAGGVFIPPCKCRNGGWWVVVPGSVPEPQSWIMMLVGFGAVGAVVRRKHDAR